MRWQWLTKGAFEATALEMAAEGSLLGHCAFEMPAPGCLWGHCAIKLAAIEATWAAVAILFQVYCWEYMRIYRDTQEYHHFIDYGPFVYKSLL